MRLLQPKPLLERPRTPYVRPSWVGSFAFGTVKVWIGNNRTPFAEDGMTDMGLEFYDSTLSTISAPLLGDTISIRRVGYNSAIPGDVPWGWF